jgi:hypothetical protein
MYFGLLMLGERAYMADSGDLDSAAGMSGDGGHGGEFARDSDPLPSGTPVKACREAGGRN